MAMESLISLQSSGHRSIGEPTAPRPIGVDQGAVLVVLDVNKGVAPAALYWTLANVVRKGDNIKILGIITHIPSAMGFMIRVDQHTRNSPNIMELQFEIATKKEAIWRLAHVKEWCQRAGVKLGVDVKAGNNPKVIVVDEAKAMSAYHVVLDKNMKNDRKYFVDNLTCFVSRVRSSGGVDAIRSFAMPMISNKLPPMAPPTPKGVLAQPGHHYKASAGSNTSVSSNASHRGSSMSSTSFELGGESGDDYSAHDGDPPSAPSTGESLDLHLHLKIRTTIQTAKSAPNLYHLLRSPVHDHSAVDALYNLNVNPLRKPTVRKWLHDDDADSSCLVTPCFTPRSSEASECRFDPSLTPRRVPRDLSREGSRELVREGSRDGLVREGSLELVRDAVLRGQHQRKGSNAWIGQLNVAPEMGPNRSLGRQYSLVATTLRTQASFNGGRSPLRHDKVALDVLWPLMNWADSRRGTRLGRTQFANQTVILASHNSMNHFRAAVRKGRVPVSSGLNYSDMVDSD